MDKIRIIHDALGETLTVWLDDPSKECICEETTEEVIFMKDDEGRVIGFEFLHYQPSSGSKDLAVETIVRKSA
jgi:hypothetical protein